METKFGRPRRFGYTLIELLVVMMIIAMVAVIGFWGLRYNDTAEKLTQAQKDLVSHLRTAQNQATAGAGGNANLTRTGVFTKGATSYAVSDVSYLLPPGVSISSNTVIICFNNPNISLSATCGTSFTNLGVSPVTLTLSAGTLNKSVNIEGVGASVIRIYEN